MHVFNLALPPQGFTNKMNPYTDIIAMRKNDNQVHRVRIPRQI